jgi:hypothetical protein
MARKKPTPIELTEQAVALAEFAARALVAAEDLAIKKKAIEQFPLNDSERAVLAACATLSATLQRKLAQPNARFTIAETASLLMGLAEDLLEGEPLRRLNLLFISKKLADCLEDNIVPSRPAKAKPPKHKPTGHLYQFKITLLEAQPAIWRRIQVQDCTLDQLHEHIQTAMGWTNSHLHQFEIQEQRYGDPELLDDGFEDFECVDSRRTLLSQILPQRKKRSAFLEEYDFGDGWQHEILFEGSPAMNPKAKYPLCLEGERACPPEDCGGVWGYADFLAAIGDPQHEDHEQLLEWIGGSFDPEEFAAATATKSMKRGLPDWRSL